MSTMGKLITILNVNRSLVLPQEYFKLRELRCTSFHAFRGRSVLKENEHNGGLFLIPQLARSQSLGVFREKFKGSDFDEIDFLSIHA